MPTPRQPVMLDILEEHFEELDFLWELREGVIFAPDWNLDDLADLEERAEAHLDGLRLGGDHAIDIARPCLVGEEKGAATAAAFVFMASGRADLENELLRVFGGSPPAAREGIRVGLRHSDVSRIAAGLSHLASSGEPAARAAAADVLAFHRLPAPPRFADLLGQIDPRSRALFYGAAGRFGGPWSVDYLESSLTSDPPDAQRAALEASARLGIPDLAAACRRAAARQGNRSAEALAFLGVLADPQDLPLLESCAGGPQLAPAAFAALGALGIVQGVPALIRGMSDPNLAHAAGSAFVRMTGAVGIEADQPGPAPADLSDDDKDLWDARRPPDPSRAQAWWEKEKTRFRADARWQSGLEVGQAPMGPVFREVALQSRRDLYLAERARNFDRTADLELERRAARQTI